jgi:hypothetical protein
LSWFGQGNVGAVATTQNYTVAIMAAAYNGTALDLYLMDEVVFPTGGVASSIKGVISFDRYTIVEGTGLGNYVTITLPDTFRNILRISTAADGTMLPQVAYREDLMNPQLTTGTPSEWYTVGNRIFFDVYPSAPLWLTIEYQRLPNAVEALDDVIDIPKEWHSVLLMLVSWKEMKRLQDVEKEMALKSQLNSIINQLRTEEEEEFLRESSRGFYVRKETR